MSTTAASPPRWVSELCEPVREQHALLERQIGREDPYLSRDCLGLHEVLKAHFLIADHFYLLGQGLGGIGLRDFNLLHSALFRQHVSLGGRLKWEDPIMRVATTLYGLIMDHPFHDANKRTAFLSTLYYLQKIRRLPTATAREFEDFTVEIADHKLSRYSRYIDEERRDPNDAAVRFIGHFLRRNTREVDKREYTITFRQLDGILRRHGYELRNADKNYIEVVRRTVERTWLGKAKVSEERMITIGFHGWTREVPRDAIRAVREKTKLDEEHGIDSRSFYGDVDPLPALLAEYHDQLMRLAHR